MKNINKDLRLIQGAWTMMKYFINIRNPVLCLAKVFLIFMISLCFGLIGVGLWVDPAHALKGGLPVCEANLSTCTANLGTCNGSLSTCDSSLNTCNANETTCQTDLTTCNANLTACQASSQTFPGDGYSNPDGLGVSGHGPALSYTNNGDGTVTDDNTKFIWEIKTNVAGSAHNVTNTYTWSSSGTAPDGTLFTDFLHKLNNTCDGDESTSCASNANCIGKGNGLCGFAGHRDWCIPNVRQLNSIADYGQTNPTIDPTFPGLTTAFFYWSATTASDDATRALGVDFFRGDVLRGLKSTEAFPVRAGRPCP